jgi:glycosyltransferase involved in cell wall biosynthesis
LENLKRLVTELNLENEVSFLGSLTGEKLIRTLNEHQVMLVPSKWQEPFGVVVLEGIACGCIPIVSDSGGLRDAVGNAGLIFKNGDVDDLTEKMNLLFTDVNLKNELIAKSTAHLSNFHPKKIISQYLEAIEGSLNK